MWRALTPRMTHWATMGESIKGDVGVGSGNTTLYLFPAKPLLVHLKSCLTPNSLIFGTFPQTISKMHVIVLLYVGVYIYIYIYIYI